MLKRVTNDYNGLTDPTKAITKAMKVIQGCLFQDRKTFTLQPHEVRRVRLM